MRVRDLRTVTGEDGLWVSLEDIVARDGGKSYGLDEEEEEEGEEDGREGRGYGREVEEQVVMIERREGWDKNKEGKRKEKGNGAGEI